VREHEDEQARQMAMTGRLVIVIGVLLGFLVILLRRRGYL
jgi:hypothetical protein